MPQPWPTPDRLMQFTRKSLIPGVNLDGPLSYTFRLNPEKLTVARKKLEKWSFTKAGFERVDWGQDMIQLNYTGKFGVFRIDEPAPGQPQATSVELFDIRTSLAWAKFAEFEKYFRNTEEEQLEMTWWQQPMNQVGSIGEFIYDVDAHDPFIIAYHFRFSAVPDNDRPDIIINATQANS